ncbi:MAG: hypothetical protein ACOY7J_01290, partial [Pseudomonadota bacterium]
HVVSDLLFWLWRQQSNPEHLSLVFSGEPGPDRHARHYCFQRHIILLTSLTPPPDRSNKKSVLFVRTTNQYFVFYPAISAFLSHSTDRNISGHIAQQSTSTHPPGLTLHTARHP